MSFLHIRRCHFSTHRQYGCPVDPRASEQLHDVRTAIQVLSHKICRLCWCRRLWEQLEQVRWCAVLHVIRNTIRWIERQPRRQDKTHWRTGTIGNDGVKNPARECRSLRRTEIPLQQNVEPDDPAPPVCAGMFLIPAQRPDTTPLIPDGTERNQTRPPACALQQCMRQATPCVGGSTSLSRLASQKVGRLRGN